MISRTVATLDHMRCPCGRVPHLQEVRHHAETRYVVESVCCKIVTVPLRTQQRAVNEYQRMLETLCIDDQLAGYHWVPTCDYTRKGPCQLSPSP